MATGAGAVTGRGAVPYIFGGATYACVCKSKCKVIYFIFYLLVQRFVPLACRAIRFVVDCCYYCRKKKKKLQGTKITAAQSRAFPVPPNTRSNELVHVHSPGAPVFLLGPPENNSTSWTDDDDGYRDGRRCNDTTTRGTGRSPADNGGVVSYTGSAVVRSASRRLPGVGRGHRRGNGRNQILRRTRIPGATPADDAGGATPKERRREKHCAGCL